MGKFDKFKVDLSTAVRDMPPLEPLGLAYRARICWIAGPKGSAKTGICRGILLADMRRGVTVGWIDLEMTEGEHRAYFEDMGATDAELKSVHFWSYPELETKEDAREFARDIVASGVRTLVLDKWTDFLTQLGGEENSNDHANVVARHFLQPLVEGGVTVYVIDATGWSNNGQPTRMRGASEKGFKVATSWAIGVSGPHPMKDRVGQIDFRCDKDRGGDIGEGTIVTFEYGGDGNGNVIFRHLGSKTSAGAGGSAGQAGSGEGKTQYLARQIVRAVAEVAPDYAARVKRAALWDWLDANLPEGKKGSNAERIAALAVASNFGEDEDRLEAVPTGVKRGGNEVSEYHFAPGDGS